MDPIARMVAAGAAGASGVGEPGLYVDEVFSTFLYEGTGAAKTITNGIDLSGEGGMVWIKNRDDVTQHHVYDTERGVGKRLRTNDTAAEDDYASSNPTSSLTAFNSNGFSVGDFNGINGSNDDMASWTFRKAPGFFDVVTYTGNGTAGRTISHNLGSVPGMIIIKAINLSGSNWVVYHRELGASNVIFLNYTNGSGSDSAGRLSGTAPTSTVFSVGAQADTNNTGYNYVAYLFAHDDQSFGTNEDEAIIKCGSYTGNGSSDGPEIDLGFEPQWLLIKNTDTARSWWIIDVMRGMPMGSSDQLLQANETFAEYSGYSFVDPSATGFKVTTTDGNMNTSSDEYIYMAIRRPHKPPTAGTEVFTTKLWTGNGSSGTRTITGVGFTPDLVFGDRRSSGGGPAFYDRLRGKGRYVQSDTTQAEGNTQTEGGLGQASFDVDGSYGAWNNNGLSYVGWLMRRAPGFFDVVTYTGNGSNNHQITHNLGVVPEFALFKERNGADAWVHFHDMNASTYTYSFFNGGGAGTQSYGSGARMLAQPNATTLFLSDYATMNESSKNYICYLFASLDGISKIGTYSGTGSNIDVDCGFSAGARFVMIFRTDSNGDVHVWDTTRGIVSGNDPYLLLNSNAAEVTNTDYIDPLNAGFTVTSSAPASLNASGGTYLFLAIA